MVLCVVYFRFQAFCLLSRLKRPTAHLYTKEKGFIELLSVCLGSFSHWKLRRIPSLDCSIAKGTVDAFLNLHSFSCILHSRILSVAYHSFYHLCFQITVCSYIITDQLPTTAESNGLHNRRRYPLISRHTLLFAEAPLQSYFYWLRIIEVNFYDLICDPRPRDGKSAVLRAEASVEGCN